MTDYYAQRDGGRLIGPFPTYTAAMGDHADYLRYTAGPHPTMRVLLDVGSVNAIDEAETRQLLHEDPLLRAIFELGAREGIRRDRSDIPAPAIIADLLAEIEERQQLIARLRALEQARVDRECRASLDRAWRAAGLN